MKAVARILGFCVVLLFGVFANAHALDSSQPAESAKKLNKVVLVLFENTTYDATMRAPGFHALATQGALLTHYKAITNPSQPNYIAIMAGDTMGVYGDGDVDLDAKNLVDLLEAKGLQWKVYAEGYPGNCFLGSTSGAYARKHNPLISFTDIQRNKQRCERIVRSEDFAQDLATGRLPEFSHYVTDMNNSGHETGLEGANDFLEKKLMPLMKSEQGQRVTWIITFDEGHIFNNQIATIVYGDQVKVGAQSAQSYNHYSLLRTIEEGFALGTLGRKDSKAAPFLGIWN